MKKKTSKKRKNNTSYLLVGLFALVSLIGITYSIYKTYLVREYSYIPDNAEEVKKGLVVRNTITLKKQVLEDDNYIEEENIKIRNDFEGYTVEEKETEYAPTRYIIYEDNLIKEGFYIGKMPQYIDIFTSDDLDFFGIEDESVVPIKEKYTKADRKNFLEKNKIKDDIDFINYIRENYYLKNTLFMSKKTMMQNYAFNLLTSIAIPQVDSITLIEGEYQGYIFNTNKIRSINIIEKDELYTFTGIGDKFQDDEYLVDLLSTLDIE